MTDSGPVTKAGGEGRQHARRSVAARQGDLRRRFSQWRPTTIHGAFDDAAALHPDRPFLITDERQWTYAEMQVWTRRIAAGLRQRGLRAGAKVALLLANYPEFVALKFAVARLGAIAVPINILNRAEELRYLIAQSDSVLLVTMDWFRGTDYLAILDAIMPGWREGAPTSDFPALRGVVVLPTGEIGKATGLPAIFADLDGDPEGIEWPTVAPGDDCDILYTSGTTGDPKGVQLTHDMLTRTAFGSAYARAFEDGHRILFSLPMYHVFGYVEGLLAVCWVGGAIVPQLRFDAHETLAAIERYDATDALLIPAMSLALLDRAAEATYDLSSLRHALASGGRAPVRVWQGLRERLGVDEITTGYGMTETTASTTVTRPDDPEERLLTTNGRQRDVGPAGDPLLDRRLVAYRVLDEGRDVAAGETGELVARGPGVTRGYYNKPEATTAAFTADGWLRTGDLGRIDADGYISLVGRTKESYRCGGEQVLPTEVEDLLTSHPDVVQAHVVPIADERMGEVGVAFVVLRDGAAVGSDELIQLVQGRLARFKVPRHLLLVDPAAIPVTASGRARKFLLSERAAEMLTLV